MIAPPSFELTLDVGMLMAQMTCIQGTLNATSAIDAALDARFTENGWIEPMPQTCKGSY